MRPHGWSVSDGWRIVVWHSKWQEMSGRKCADQLWDWRSVWFNFILNTQCAVLYVMDTALGQSLPPRQGLKSISSSRQLAAQYDHTTVHEELDEDTSPVNDSRVYFDVGDDASYVIVLLSVSLGYSLVKTERVLMAPVAFLSNDHCLLHHSWCWGQECFRQSRVLPRHSDNLELTTRWSHW